MTGPDTEPYSGRRSVLGRTFDILECFTWLESDQTIANLCEATGLPAATVHRHLATLVECDAVERTGRGQYRLGMRLWRLGWGVPGARIVRDVARPFMVDLYALTHQIVVLGSRDGTDLVMVDQIAGSSSGTAWNSTRRVPLGSIAPGLQFLAHLPTAEVAAMLREGTLGVPAELASDELRLGQMLGRIRASGVALTKGPERCWLAAPIYEAEGVLRSTLSLVVAHEGLDLAVQCKALSRAAWAISQGLASCGHSGGRDER